MSCFLYKLFPYIFYFIFFDSLCDTDFVIRFSMEKINDNFVLLLKCLIFFVDSLEKLV